MDIDIAQVNPGEPIVVVILDGEAVVQYSPEGPKRMTKDLAQLLQAQQYLMDCHQKVAGLIKYVAIEKPNNERRQKKGHSEASQLDYEEPDVGQ